MAGLKRYWEFDAWQLAEKFKKEIYRIVTSSPAACADLKYRGQTLDAAARASANFAEGFLRRSPGDLRDSWTMAPGRSEKPSVVSMTGSNLAISQPPIASPPSPSVAGHCRLSYD